MERILVTGGTGFIGSGLTSRLLEEGFPIRRLLRRSAVTSGQAVEDLVTGDLSPPSDLRAALGGVDQVIHLAALVHKKRDQAAGRDYQRYNVEFTLHLGQEAAAQGVRRFIFISSIKVNGEETPLGRPFTEDDHPAPQDAYAVSKWEAEEGLLKLAAETGMEVVIIRPPLVYGPGVKANFSSMMQMVARGVPLPLGAIYNRRSLVALENLVDLIATCIVHPAAANQTFLAGDGEDLSTPKLLRRLGDALGRPARLLPVPVRIIETGATLMGKRDIARRLCGSLQVDISKARTLLGWHPPVSVDEALQATARHFLESRARGKGEAASGKR